MARMNRELRETRAILVAEKKLEDRLGVIAWEEEFMYPTLDKVKAGELKISYTPTVLPQPALETGDAG